jgi:hypothetical protein
MNPFSKMMASFQRRREVSGEQEKLHKEALGRFLAEKEKIGSWGDAAKLKRIESLIAHLEKGGKLSSLKVTPQNVEAAKSLLADLRKQRQALGAFPKLEENARAIALDRIIDVLSERVGAFKK